MIGMMAMAAAFVTCPGGPIFAFHPGSSDFTAPAEDAFPAYAENLRSELWRDGWITVTAVVARRADPRTLRLVHRREQVIWQRMARLGVARARVRFEIVEAKNDDDLRDWIDAYSSTLNTPQDVWDRMVEPGLMC